MTWLALLLALLIEAFRPQAFGLKLQTLWVTWVQSATRRLAVRRWPGPRLVVVVAVTLPAAMVAGVYAFLQQGSSLLGLLFEVVVLVACLGAQALRLRFLAVRDALERDDLDRASSLLAEWTGGDAATLRHDAVRELARHALVQAHRQVLGLLFAFVALAALGFGPAGAVLYRLACALGSPGRADDAAPHAATASDTGSGPASDPISGPTSDANTDTDAAAEVAARAVLDAVDQVPARLTAVGFAVVGHFDHAMTAWRRDAAVWDDTAAGIVLAAASGAAGADLAPQPAPLGTPTPSPSAATAESPVLPAGEGAPAVALPVSALTSLAALVSRSVLLWMLLLALLTLANVIG